MAGLHRGGGEGESYQDIRDTRQEWWRQPLRGRVHQGEVWGWWGELTNLLCPPGLSAGHGAARHAQRKSGPGQGSRRLIGKNGNFIKNISILSDVTFPSGLLLLLLFTSQSLAETGGVGSKCKISFLSPVSTSPAIKFYSSMLDCFSYLLIICPAVGSRPQYEAHNKNAIKRIVQ